MSQSRSFEENYKLNAEKRDLEIEVGHLKEGMLSKNQEISNLKTKLRRAEAELFSLHKYLASHITFLSNKLNSPPEPSHPTSPQQSDLVSSPPDPVGQSLSLSETVFAKKTLHTKLKVTTAPSRHPVSRSQPVLMRTRSAKMFENVEGSAGSAKTCSKCCAKFTTAMKLSMHMNTMHASILVSDDDFTPVYSYQTPKKIRVRVSSPEASINSDLVKLKASKQGEASITSDLVKRKAFKQVQASIKSGLVKHKAFKQIQASIKSDLVKHKGFKQIQCPDCGRCLLRKNLSVHKEKWCKGGVVENPGVIRIYYYTILYYIAKPRYY